MANKNRVWKFGQGSTLNNIEAICEKAEQENPGFKVFQILTSTEPAADKSSPIALPGLAQKVQVMVQVYYPLLVKEPKK